MSKKLSARQLAALPVLLESRGLGAAAQALKLNRKTLTRWLAEPEFQMALRQAEQAFLESATRRLIGLAEPAIDALESILNEPTQEGASVRRLAAVALLDRIDTLRTHLFLEERVNELEVLVREKLREKSR